MIPTLSQVCSLTSRFDADIEDYAAGKCESVEIWLTKLEDYLERHSVTEVKDWLAKFGVSAPVASLQGGILASQGERRKEAWDLFLRRLEICKAIGTGTVVIACDVPQPLSQETIERVQFSLVQAAQECGKRGLRAALEFQSNSAFGNNLQTATALITEAGSPHLGICLDAFHFFTGPSKTEDLAYLTTSNLFHVQLCDLLDTPRELAADSHRILPGDGDFPLQPLIDHLHTIKYVGCVSLELLNPQLWQVPPRQLGEIGMTVLRKILGQAAM